MRCRPWPSSRCCFEPQVCIDERFAETSLDGRSLQFGTLSMGGDHIEWFLGAAGFPSIEGEDVQDRVVSPKNGVNSRDIKLHALRYQKDHSR